MLKKIGIGFVLLIALVLGFAATRPDTYAVTRSITMAAPASIAFGMVNDFHQWGAWSPWDQLDLKQTKTYTGAPSGTGAKYAWAGDKKVGQGRMTIEDSKPSETVTIKLEFLEPFASTSQTVFSFKGVGTSTEVTWRMNGTNNFMTKVFLMDMDKMIGPDFEKGLATMKTLAETETKKQADAAAAVAAAVNAKMVADAAAAAAVAAAAPAAQGVPTAAH